MISKATSQEVSARVAAMLREIRECHPEGKLECYCDNGHEQANTVCMFCYHTMPA